MPLLLVVIEPGRRKLPLVAAWLGGLVFWLLAVQWVLATDRSAWPGWLAMALALSLFWVAFVGITRFILRRTDLPLTVIVPVVWVALEYVRAYTLTGFPWYYLAHSQFRQIYWTQIADFAGSLGLSFLIVLVNSALVELALLLSGRNLNSISSAPLSDGRKVARWQWVRWGCVASSTLATLGYGVYRVQTATFRSGPLVAMLQSNEIQGYGPDQRKTRAVLQQLYLTMVENAINMNPKPDLIVWPETAYPYTFVTVDAELTSKALDEQVKTFDPDSIGSDWTKIRDQNNLALRQILERTKIPMMLGITTHDFRLAGPARYNSAVLVRPGSDPQSYHKMHLVPFGEYVPLVDMLPWLMIFVPFDHVPLLNFGESPRWFDLGSYRMAAAICFEDTLPHVVRRSFSEVPDEAQPDLIINLSNEGWFGATSEHEMHLAISTFRCIENRVPMARAVNTGVSAMIDGNGAIVAAVGKNKQEVLSVATPLDDRTSLYSQWGDWLGQITLAGTIGFLVLGLIAPRRSPSSTDSRRRESTRPAQTPA